jgi:hypothetical protein
MAGLALPLAVSRIIGSSDVVLGWALVGALAGAIVLTRFHGRAEGWKITVGVLTVFALLSVIR